MFIYVFIGFEPLGRLYIAPSPSLSRSTSALTQQFLSHKRAWPVDGESVWGEGVLEGCCCVEWKRKKEKQNKTQGWADFLYILFLIFKKDKLLLLALFFFAVVGLVYA